MYKILGGGGKGPPEPEPPEPAGTPGPDRPGQTGRVSGRPGISKYVIIWSKLMKSNENLWKSMKIILKYLISWWD